MTQDEIIAMANEAGLSNEGLPFWDEWAADNDGLQRFAALVAHKEREACEQAANKAAESWGGVEGILAIGRAVEFIRARGTKEGV